MHDRPLHGDMDTDGDLIEAHEWDELCPRCGKIMGWLHSSPYCLNPMCRYKPGCCS
jgi:hypothetical protein